MRSILKRKWKLQDQKLELRTRLNRVNMEIEELKREMSDALATVDNAQCMLRDCEALICVVQDWREAIIAQTHDYQKLKEEFGRLSLRTDEVQTRLRILDTDEEAKALQTELKDLSETYMKGKTDASRIFARLPELCIPEVGSSGHSIPSISSACGLEDDENPPALPPRPPCANIDNEEEAPPALPPRPTVKSEPYRLGGS